MTYNDLWRRLLPHYEEREAKAVVRTLMEELFQLTLTDLYSGGLDKLTPTEQQRLETSLQQLEAGIPVQYVTGTARFFGRDYVVNRHVLIPRPETEVLCKTILSAYNKSYCALQPPVPLRVLDIGTGSGCIAVTLALDLWNSSVSAWDISGEALLTARENAHRLQAQVNFEWHDVLSLDEAALAATPFDIIVSNPPYVCDYERKDMTEQVLAHEPHTALFVPDNDPLLFYRAIA
ncbi:HemK/PrmC family methyltransferase, partial [Segatella salivae]|uniref:N5-glutamine methyltransferase family protein n=1 Tax=Segatella salivae TaxID=228604 RepID=UPI0028DC9E66